MKVRETALPGVLCVEPPRFDDARGYFTELYHREKYAESGIDPVFVQDNVSCSRGGVLRGLHYQHPHDQAKLVYVLQGEVFDVAVDVRVGSPTFGRFACAPLTAANGCQLYIPEGFAHGFCALSEIAVVAYKCSTHYHPEAERVVRWNDPELAIPWPIAAPDLNPRDRDAPRLGQIDPSTLPAYR